MCGVTCAKGVFFGGEGRSLDTPARAALRSSGGQQKGGSREGKGPGFRVEGQRATQAIHPLGDLGRVPPRRAIMEGEICLRICLQGRRDCSVSVLDVLVKNKKICVLYIYMFYTNVERKLVL